LEYARSLVRRRGGAEEEAWTMVEGESGDEVLEREADGQEGDGQEGDGFVAA
jgi:hypothetical protein